MAITRLQVEIQLKRILESATFGGGRKHSEPTRVARLLEYLVVGTLEGKPLGETAILIDFYGIPVADLDGTQDIARVGAYRLREKLETYYASTGIDDPVVISIPKGQYSAEFTLNPASDAQKQVNLGFAHVDEETPDHITKALTHFEKAIERESSLADAWAGKASAYLTMTLHAYAADPEELFIDAEHAAIKAITLDESCWRGYANLGAIYFFRHEWQKAEAAFGKAKQLAVLEISQIGGYGPYLVGLGHFDEARKLAAHYRDVGYDNAVLLTRAGLYLYATRDIDEAMESLLLACDRSPNFWRGHLGLAFVYLSLDEPQKALEEMDEVVRCARANLWPGMRIICLEAVGQSDLAEKEFDALLKLRGERYVQPMQLALGCMALGRFEEAIAFLSEACDASDPFTAWLHLWPLLDPLRPFRSFRDLLRKWKFPAPRLTP